MVGVQRRVGLTATVIARNEKLEDIWTHFCRQRLCAEAPCRGAGGMVPLSKDRHYGSGVRLHPSLGEPAADFGICYEDTGCSQDVRKSFVPLIKQRIQAPVISKTKRRNFVVFI